MLDSLASRTRRLFATGSSFDSRGLLQASSAASASAAFRSLAIRTAAHDLPLGADQARLTLRSCRATDLPLLALPDDFECTSYDWTGELEDDGNCKPVDLFGVELNGAGPHAARRRRQLRREFIGFGAGAEPCGAGLNAVQAQLPAVTSLVLGALAGSLASRRRARPAAAADATACESRHTVDCSIQYWFAFSGDAVGHASKVYLCSHRRPRVLNSDDTRTIETDRRTGPGRRRSDRRRNRAGHALPIVGVVALVACAWFAWEARGVRSELNAAIAEVQDLQQRNRAALAAARAVAPPTATWVQASDRPDRQLRPGWVTRVFQASDTQSAWPENDVGVFVLDETVFHLESHQYHGIAHEDRTSYRMSALFPVTKTGFHQLGVDLAYVGPLAGDTPRCHVRLLIGREIVIDERVSLDSRNAGRARLVAGARLELGLHPAEAELSCDYARRTSADVPGARARDVTVSFTRRCPGDSRLQAKRAGFVHSAAVLDHLPNLSMANPL